MIAATFRQLVCAAVLVAGAMPIYPADTSDDERALTPGSALGAEHASSGGVRYRIPMDPGLAAEFTLRQLRGATEVRLDDGGGRSYALQIEAGRWARLELPIVGTAARTWTVTILPRRAGATVDYEVGLSATHAAGPSDTALLAAFAAYVEAEKLRRANIREGALAERDATAIANARDRYQAAIDRGTSAQAGCVTRRARIGLARLEVGLGNYVEGSKQSRAALAERCEGDLAEQAQAAKTDAMAAAYEGDFSASSDAHERSLALYKQTGDAFYQGIELGNLSEVYAKLGATSRALDAARNALEIAEQTGDSQGVVYNRAGIGAIHLSRGELAAALDSYRQTLRDLEKQPYPMIEGETYNGLGIVHHRMGDVDQSLRAYTKAEAIWNTTNNRVGMAQTRIDEGELLLENGRRDDASRSFQQALDIARADGLKSQEVHAMRGLGASAASASRWEQARVAFEASRDLAHGIGEVAAESYALRALADLDARRKRFSEAEATYARSLALATDAGDLGGEAGTLAALSRTLADAGKLAEARTAIERALVIIERQRAEIEDPSLRTGYFASLRSYYDTHIDVLMALERREPGKGHAFAALVSAERARARALQDSLAEHAIRIDRDVDASLVAATLAEQERLRTAAWQLARLPRGAAGNGARDKLVAEVDAASRSLDQARGRVRSASPRFAQLADPQPLTLPELQRQLLDADTTALEFWLGERHSYLWVVTSQAVRTFTLPRSATLEPVIAAFREALSASPAASAEGGIEAITARSEGSQRAVRALATKLGSMLFPTPLGAAAKRRLAIVADGGLDLVPAGVLVAPGEEGALSSRHDLTTLPSLVTLRWLRTAKAAARDSRQPAPTAVAVFADPVFRADDNRLGVRSASLDEPPSITRSARDFDITRLARLTQSRNEAMAIAGLLPRERSWLAMDFSATREAALHADWRQYSIVHFAAHTLVDLKQPELSGIVLSLYDPAGKPVDGFVRVSDIYNLDMPADLVVLSACESAVGKAVAAEGIFSLSRAFFYAGAPRVLASLWLVDDRATAALMSRFYRALLVEKRSPAQALRIAQDELASQPRWQSPYYWAGFVLQGDWVRSPSS
ncbi:MAG: CHAT domain-containing protein [Gammaproteobacteria bacterium]